jgi:uroporphyrinogen-III synthase
MRLLLTRPEPDGERTAAELRARGHEVLLAPLLQIEPVADAELGAGPWAAVLLTSANGARAIASHPRRSELVRLPVLAVGPASAGAARAAGFVDVVSADGDGGDLTRLAARRFAGASQPLLYLAGADRAHDLAAELAAANVEVRTVVVYRAVADAKLPPAAREALAAGRIDGIIHFSRRSVESYLAAAHGLPDAALKLVHFCLSERAAEPLRIAGAADVRVPARPNEAALLALVAAQN